MKYYIIKITEINNAYESGGYMTFEASTQKQAHKKANNILREWRGTGTKIRGTDRYDFGDGIECYIDSFEEIATKEEYDIVNKYL